MFILFAAWAAPTDTTFSVDRGFFSAPFTVTITSDDPAATVRYTLDGSTPSPTAGTVYTGPVSISTTTVLRTLAYDGVDQTNVDTSTYIFPADVKDQVRPSSWPTTWNGNPADYGIDPEIVVDPRYGPQLTAVLTAPTLSLVTDTDNLWDPGTGIYVNTYGEGVGWERAVSVEMIDPGGVDWQEDAGLRITGGASRNPNNSPKHGLRLLFKAVYGETKLRRDVFAEGATDSFDTLVLRSGYNHSWYHWSSGQRNISQYLRDSWMAQSQIDMGHAGTHFRMVHLYLNGIYWGMYKLQERPEASFASDYYGGDKLEWDAVNSGEVVDGDLVAWNALHAAADLDLSQPANYATIQQLLDTESLIDFMVLNFYGGNTDWDFHNYYAARRRLPGEGWKFFSWDAEHSLKSLTENRLSANYNGHPTSVHQALRSNAEYRLWFADRVHQHLFNDGALTCSAALNRYSALAALVEQPVIAESARWGDYRRDVLPAGSADLYTLDDHWIPQRDDKLANYFPTRCDVVLSQLEAGNLYPSLDAPEFSDHGGRFPGGTGISISNPDGVGTIYTTTDGSDPRAPGGAVAGAAYTGPISVTGPTQIRARILDGGTWSAELSAWFYVEQPFADLVINEMLYHSVIDSEFLELYNNGSSPIDLSGTAFDEGIHFEFPVGTVLLPGQFLVLSESVVDFTLDWGVPPDFEYRGHLSNGGETVRIGDVDGSEVASVSYLTVAPWPPEPDGTGPSLERVDPGLDPADPASWQASYVTNGTPWLPNSCDLGDFYADTDADGFGDPLVGVSACEAPPGHLLDDTDCDDTDGTIYPGAPEVCDGIDSDCSGGLEVIADWFADVDSDGFGDPADSITDCLQPPGRVADDTDCDDADGSTYPGAVETCDGVDNDCDTVVDNGVLFTSWFLDGDSDGFGDALDAVSDCAQPAGRVADDTDCDDSSAAVYPGAPDVCDGIDSDCDGTVETVVNYWRDSDGDTWGDSNDTVAGCSQPAGYVDRPSDCNDLDGSIHPGAPEICDGIDQDCNSQIDDGIPGQTWYTDADSDGFGDSANTVQDCAQPPGTSVAGGDCDDGDSSRFPGAPEYCDGVDSNCNTQPDDNAVDATPTYADLDGDGHGDPLDVLASCSPVADRVLTPDDCDDTEPLAYDGAEEVCDGVDNDCDGGTDLDATDALSWYLDLDGDGHGGTAVVLSCSQPLDHVALGDDCDDGDFNTHPAAPEQCDAIDHDCEGTPDNGVVDLLWYIDDDGDGYGTAASFLTDCVQPVGYAINPGDCAADDPEVHPGEQEVCDGIDNDCSGAVDDDALDGVARWVDGDEDGFGTGTSVLLCGAQPGTSDNGDDCDDGAFDVFPGAPEYCDGRDGDCDGTIDDEPLDGALVYGDADGDSFGDPSVSSVQCAMAAGWVGNAGDCDDDEPLAWFDALEVCGDGVDNDCDGLMDDDDAALDPSSVTTFYEDLDGDGFGAGEPLFACTSQGALDATDCDDTDDAVYPGAVEVLGDGIDQDCDGVDLPLDLVRDTSDTSDPEVVEPVEKGCGCGTSSPMGVWPLGLLLLGLRRRNGLAWVLVPRVGTRHSTTNWRVP